MQAHIDKINEMASVMRKAIEVDEGRICEDEERIKQLEVKANSLSCCTLNYVFIVEACRNMYRDITTCPSLNLTLHTQ